MIRAKGTTHTYTEWRQRVSDRQLQIILSRLEKRKQRDGDDAVLTDDQRLILLLAQFLDEGGETTEYIRDLADAE